MGPIFNSRQPPQVGPGNSNTSSFQWGGHVWTCVFAYAHTKHSPNPRSGARNHQRASNFNHAPQSQGGADVGVARHRFAEEGLVPKPDFALKRLPPHFSKFVGQFSGLLFPRA